MEYTFETYNLKLLDATDNTCKTVLSLITGTGTALNKERRKLYVVHYYTERLYVGEANTSIKVRFQRGCNSFNSYIKNRKAKNGYKGYKWLNKANNQQRNLTVSVAVFSEDYDHDDKRAFVEAIEGELVYLIRQETGKWPLFQNEILFSNCDGAKEIAESILEKVISEELV